MNITHAKEEVIQGDKLEAIFARQKSLMEKYHHIEAKSGLLQTEDCPVNLNCRKGQARLKDFAWRTAEETGEALDTWYDHDCKPDNLHFQEELVDALHFLTEFTILAGYTPEMLIAGYTKSDDEDILDFMFNQVTEFTDSVPVAYTHFMRQLSMTCNTLKNKPWKQTQMITDKLEFNNRMVMTWGRFIGLLKASGLNSEMTAMLYLKKSQVNAFRQRSNY